MFAAKNLTASTPPVLFDAVGAGTAGALTNPSWSHTVGKSPAHQQTLVVAALNGVTANPTACKLGAQSMTEIGATAYTFGSGYLSMWYCYTTLSGAQTITATASNAFAACGSVSYLNARSLYNTGGLSGSAATSITTTSMGFPAPGSISVVAFSTSNSGSWSGFSGTSRFNTPFNSGVNYGFFMGDAATASTFSITSPGGSTAYVVANWGP